jgi:hypothetical protein
MTKRELLDLIRRHSRRITFSCPQMATVSLGKLGLIGALLTVAVIWRPDAVSPSPATLQSEESAPGDTST